MKIFLGILLLILPIFGLEFKVATYNVENLFDLNYDRTEYREFKPNTKTWNRFALQKKLQNISKVIKQLDPDIISLQEIESKKALYLLNQKLHFKYFFFLKNRNSAVGVAILSKFKIVQNTKINIKVFDTYSRPILKSTIMVDGKKLIIYTNHWRSKRARESKRIPYALALKNDIDNLDNEDYIILGDLNSNYDEFETFKYNRKLNDSFGITAINQILNTTMGKNFITKDNIFNFNEKVNYNLWLELPKQKRFSVLFRGTKSTPDSIIISKSLLDNKNISYINNSFGVFKPSYLLRNNNINRWNLKKKQGYSDHLPIFAKFTTNNSTIQANVNINNKNNFFIDDLYSMQTLKEPIELKNCIVIYKYLPYTIIKQSNHRAIVIYNKNIDLKLGYSYDITVGSIDNYNGLKEIKSIVNFQKNYFVKDFKNYYIDALKIDIFSDKNQNEIVKKLKGIYKKGYLHLRNGKKIKLFFDKSIFNQIKIKDGMTLYIHTGHISTFKSKNQIFIHRLNDLKVY